MWFYVAHFCHFIYQHMHHCIDFKKLLWYTLRPQNMLHCTQTNFFWGTFFLNTPRHCNWGTSTWYWGFHHQRVQAKPAPRGTKVNYQPLTLHSHHQPHDCTRMDRVKKSFECSCINCDRQRRLKHSVHKPNIHTERWNTTQVHIHSLWPTQHWTPG